MTTTLTNFLEPDAAGRCIPCRQPWTAHAPDCPNGLPCAYPPGCPAAAMPGHQLCQRHHAAVWALVGSR
jgi:hypothetical protein